jgi:hypothetical protein
MRSETRINVILNFHGCKKNKLRELSAYFHRIHLRSLKVHHFGMVEAMRLENVAWRSPSMTPPTYQIS